MAAGSGDFTELHLDSVIYIGSGGALVSRVASAGALTVAPAPVWANGRVLVVVVKGGVTYFGGCQFQESKNDQNKNWATFSLAQY